MIETLSLLFILIAIIEFFVGYKIISKSDPFTFVSLISIRFIFDFVMRPFTFTFIEKFEPGISGINRGLIGISDAPFYSLMTIILNDLAFLFVLIGAFVYIKNKSTTRVKSNIDKSDLNKYLFAGFIVFIIGLINWYWVMQSSGGLINVLFSLGTGRQHLFRINGSTIPLEIAKSFLSAGIFLISSYLFIKRKWLFAWLSIIILFILLLSFGGRGLAVAAVISGLIAHNYFYKKINLAKLLILFLIAIPMLTFMSDVRRLLDGNSEFEDLKLTSIFEIDSFKQYLIEFSYVSSAYDYDMGFHYSIIENNKDYYIGEYPLGLGMLLPRTLFPNKGNTLANKFAEKLFCDGQAGCNLDIGVSPSIVSSSAAYWGYISIPLISFLIGYFGMFFWRTTVYKIDSPLSIMVYALGYPYAMTLFLDLGAFLAASVPILLVTSISYILLKYPNKIFFSSPKKNLSKI